MPVAPLGVKRDPQRSVALIVAEGNTADLSCRGRAEALAPDGAGQPVVQADVHNALTAMKRLGLHP